MIVKVNRVKLLAFNYRSMSMEKSNERNQMATASSMFIIHVGILRTVVNTENAQYYGIQVGLVVTALVLQVNHKHFTI